MPNKRFNSKRGAARKGVSAVDSNVPGDHLRAVSEVQQLENLKNDGNKLFVANEYEKALAVYQQVLDGLPKSLSSLPSSLPSLSPVMPLAVACHANRAKCLLCLDEAEAARCEAAIGCAIDSAHIRCRYRLAEALVALHRYSEAIDALNSLLKQVARIRFITRSHNTEQLA